MQRIGDISISLKKKINMIQIYGWKRSRTEDLFKVFSHTCCAPENPAKISFLGKYQNKEKYWNTFQGNLSKQLRCKISQKMFSHFIIQTFSPLRAKSFLMTSWKILQNLTSTYFSKKDKISDLFCGWKRYFIKQFFEPELTFLQSFSNY